MAAFKVVRVNLSLSVLLGALGDQLERQLRARRQGQVPFPMTQTGSRFMIESSPASLPAGLQWRTTTKFFKTLPVINWNHVNGSSCRLAEPASQARLTLKCGPTHDCVCEPQDDRASALVQLPWFTTTTGCYRQWNCSSRLHSMSTSSQ